MPAAAPLLVTSGTGVAPAASAAPATVDIHTQVHDAFEARKLILQELTALDDQRKDLGRTTALAYASDVSTNGVDPAKAITARDAWQTKDAQIVAQHDALADLLQLIETRIEEFKRKYKTEVSEVLRDQIAALSEDLSEQERAEHLTEKQLKVLWNELRDVDPGYLATMAKESSLRLSAAPKKEATGAKKNTGKK